MRGMTAISYMIFCFAEFACSPYDVISGAASYSRPSPLMLTVEQKIGILKPGKVQEDQIFELSNILQKCLKWSKSSK